MLTNFNSPEAKAAASDEEIIALRYSLAEFAAATFSGVGKKLHLAGAIIGGDRAAGLSPFHNGSDEVGAVGLVLQISGELAGSATELYKSGKCYAASALLRQVEELEYLSWAFHTRNRDAERWLRSSGDERRQFFTPAKLRAGAQGSFRSKDYEFHCELGGHPVPGAIAPLRGDVSVTRLMLSDMIGHLGRIWDHIVGWSASSNISEIIQQPHAEMVRKFMAWKQCDLLAQLPPP